MASADHNPSGTLFDAAAMLGYFAQLDELLANAEDAAPVHLHIAGGAVIATKSNARVTADVDVVSEGMTEPLRRAVAEVSRRNPGLRPDWLNDGAKLKRVRLPMEPERIYTGRCLIINSAGDRYVLAMKLASGRRADEADCELLIRNLGIHSHDELLDLIEQAIPAHVQTPAMGYFAAECLHRAYRRPRT